MKIIHFTGIRLGASFPEWPEQADGIRRSLNELLIQLFERARASQVDALVSAGEMFDSNSVAVDDVQTVKELCAAYPDIALVLVPGSRDAWGPQSVYHHLLSQVPANLKVVTPNSLAPTSVADGLRIYAVSRDVASKTLPSLAQFARTEDDGTHVAVVCSDVGRIKPGPEDGLVMVSPSVIQHPFDYLAMGDGGGGANVGHADRPACYAGVPSVHTGQDDCAAVAWQVEFGAGGAALQKLELKGIVRKEAALDVSALADDRAVAEAIVALGDEHTLMSVVLTGTRPADHPIFDQVLAHHCGGRVLALHVLDATELVAPEALSTNHPALALLWDRYRQANTDERLMWADALKLYTSGVTDPTEWPEAPWAR